MPESRLIDTNVLIYLVKHDPRTAHLAEAYRPHVDGFAGLISFVTVGELFRTRVHESWSRERTAGLDAFIARFKVVHTDDVLCRAWGRVVGELAREGRTPSYADSWVAVTALVLGVPIVTHTRRHFESIPGLTVISETAEPVMPPQRTEAQRRLRALLGTLDTQQTEQALVYIEGLLAPDAFDRDA
jgi:predicted nucleic acid-binding protein